MAETSPAAQAAAELVAGAARLVEAPEGEQPAPETAEETPGVPSFEADLSGIEDLLEAPPEDEEDEEPPSFEEPDPEDSYDPDQTQAKLRKLEKQLAWEREQRIKQGTKNWKAEAAKRFPLADVDEIQATSRRAFLRAAADQHQRYERKLKPILSQVEALKGEAIQTIREEERGRAANAWGRPTAGPQQPLTETAEQASEEQRINDPRNYGKFQDYMRAQFRGGRLKGGI